MQGHSSSQLLIVLIVIRQQKTQHRGFEKLAWAAKSAISRIVSRNTRTINSRDFEGRLRLSLSADASHLVDDYSAFFFVGQVQPAKIRFDIGGRNIHRPGEYPPVGQRR